MDKLTLKIVSTACRMADMTAEGVHCENSSNHFIIMDFHLMLIWMHKILGFFELDHFSLSCNYSQSIVDLILVCADLDIPVFVPSQKF